MSIRVIVVQAVIMLIVLTGFGCSESKHAIARSGNNKTSSQFLYAKAKNEQRPRWLREFDQITESIRAGRDEEAITAIIIFNRRHPDKKTMGLMELLTIYQKRADRDRMFTTYEELMSLEEQGRFPFSIDIREVSAHLIECERRNLPESVRRCHRLILQEGKSSCYSQIEPLPSPETEREKHLYVLAYIACYNGISNLELTTRCLEQVLADHNRNCYLNLMLAFTYGLIRQKEKATMLLDLAESQNPPTEVRQKIEAYREIVRAMRPVPHSLH